MSHRDEEGWVWDGSVYWPKKNEKPEWKFYTSLSQDSNIFFAKIGEGIWDREVSSSEPTVKKKISSE